MREPSAERMAAGNELASTSPSRGFGVQPSDLDTEGARELAAMQASLMALYTDASARAIAPERGEEDEVGAPGGLDQLRQWSRDQEAALRSFARSLVAKRFGEVRKLLPATTRAFGPPLTALFNEYAARPIPAGPEPHREDAVAFADFVLAERHEAPGRPPWLRDLLRFEADALRYRAARRLFRLFVYRWRVDVIAHRLVAGLPVGEERPRRLMVLCLRVSRDAQLHRFRWGLGRRQPAPP